MGNEQAKADYQRAESLCRHGEYEEALGILDALDRQLPGSRRVTYQRALCLAGLNRRDEALACCDVLEGKLEAKQLQTLRDSISKQQASAAPAPAPAAQESPLDASGLGSAGLGSQQSARPAAAPAPMPSDTDNTFQVDSVFPLSTSETTITGKVTAGVFFTGDEVSVLSPGSPPAQASIVRIGSAETPIRLIRQGQEGMMVLGVEPQHVVPGARITSSSSADAYAETMVMSEGDNRAPAPPPKDPTRA